MSHLATQVVPKLGPTPVVLPKVQAYVLGDFMRAFGIDEYVIQIAQQGFQAGDIAGITVNGCDRTGIVEQTTLDFRDIANREATLNLDLGGATSVTEQLSRRLAQSIVYSVNTMRRRGLAIEYWYNFTPKGSANADVTRSKYGLVPTSLRPAPGMALQQVYALHHKPTGAHLSHSSARPLR